MPLITAEQLVERIAASNSKVEMPEYPERNVGNIGPFGLSSPSSNLDGRDTIDPRVGKSYCGCRELSTPAQVVEPKEQFKRRKENTLMEAEATAPPGSAFGVQATPTGPSHSHQSHTGHPNSEGADWAEARKQRIGASRPVLRKRPFIECASPYYSFEKPIKNSKRSIEDMSTPEAKRQKTVSENKSEEDDDKAKVDADVNASMDLQANPLDGTHSSTPQYTIAREVRKQSMQFGNKGAIPLKSRSERPVYSRYDTWGPVSIEMTEMTNKMRYEPRTAEEKVEAWFEAQRERVELQELDTKDSRETRLHSLASWGGPCPCEQERHGLASKDADADSISQKSPSARSTSSMNSDSRSSTTTVSSDGSSPDQKEGKASIGEISVQSASQVQTAPYEIPVPAAELHTVHTEKPVEGPAAQDTQDASQKLAPAQVTQTEITNSQPLDGSGAKKVPSLSIQALLASLDTQKDTVPGISLVNADLVDGLKQDMPKDLQLNGSSRTAQEPPTDTQSHAVLEQQAKETPGNQKKQKAPKTPHQGQKNQKKSFGPTPSKIEKPSARMTRSKAKTNHSTKFQKLDNAGRLPVDWTA